MDKYANDTQGSDSGPIVYSLHLSPINSEIKELE